MQFHHWPTAVLKAVTALEFPVQDIIWCRVGFGKKFCFSSPRRRWMLFLEASRNPDDPGVDVSGPQTRLGLGLNSNPIPFGVTRRVTRIHVKNAKMQEWPRFVHSSADVRPRFWLSRWWTQHQSMTNRTWNSLQEHLQFWAARFDKCGAKHFNKDRNWKVCPHCQTRLFSHELLLADSAFQPDPSESEGSMATSMMRTHYLLLFLSFEHSNSCNVVYSLASPVSVLETWIFHDFSITFTFFSSLVWYFWL